PPSLHDALPIFLLALTVHPDTAAGALLASRGITPQALQEAAGERVAPGARPESRTPTVDRYGRDLTALAREGGLDPVVGRADEIEQCVEVLARRTKNNPVLIGEAGVGKT